MAILATILQLLVLQRSRFQMTHWLVSRRHYDLLSVLFVLLLLTGIILSRNHVGERWWQWFEKSFSPVFSKKIFRIAIWTMMAAVTLAVTVSTTTAIYHFPIRCESGDMLPMIRQANQLLLEGQSPFAASYCPWQIPCTYLPLQITAFLPFVWLQLDLRFLSMLCFWGTLVVLFRHLYENDRKLAAFLLYGFLLTSPLLRFFLLRIQLFPYFFLVTLFLYHVVRRNAGRAAFCCGLLLAFRQTFWFSFPLVLILYWKERPVTWKRDMALGMGGLALGAAPAIFYLPSFINNLPLVWEHFQALQKKSLFLFHSLGFGYYLFDYRKTAQILFVVMALAVFFMAVRYLKPANFAVFFALIETAFLFTMHLARPEEYYALTIVMAMVYFAPVKKNPTGSRLKSVSLPVAFVLAASLIFLFYPQIAKESQFLSGSKKTLALGPFTFHATSCCEVVVMVGAKDKWQNKHSLRLSIRCLPRKSEKKGHIIIAMNERVLLRQPLESMKTNMEIREPSRHLHVGANALMIEVTNSIPFTATFQPL